MTNLSNARIFGVVLPAADLAECPLILPQLRRPHRRRRTARVRPEVFQSSIGERRRARKETLPSLARRAADAGRRYCFRVEQQCNHRPPLFPHLLSLGSARGCPPAPA